MKGKLLINIKSFIFLGLLLCLAGNAAFAQEEDETWSEETCIDYPELCNGDPIGLDPVCIGCDDEDDDDPPCFECSCDPFWCNDDNENPCPSGYYDECGECDGDGSTCSEEEEGQCDIGSSVYLGDCECFGINCDDPCENDSDGDGINDCDDNCDGLLDNCGICNGDGSSCEQGCDEICEEEEDCPSGTYNSNGDCLPCEGNMLPKLEIAPQKNSGFKGGTYGKTRKYADGTAKEHRGVDLKNDYGDPIYASHDGWIGKFGKETDDGGFGSVLVYTDSNGDKIQVLCMHLQEDNRAEGNVKMGDIIGYQGNSGNLKNAIEKGLAESHIHVKVKINGKVVNPFDILNGELDLVSQKVNNQCN